MSGDYRCRKGAACGPGAENYSALLRLPYKVIEDDGKVFLWLEDGNSSPECPDCQNETVVWAEGGFAPWHRICAWCGSHWEEHPFLFGPMDLSRPKSRKALSSMPKAADLIRHGVRWAIFLPEQGVRPLKTDSPVCAGKDCPVTWKDVLEAASEAAWAAAEDEDRIRLSGGLPALQGSWFRRARFY